jgi:hypothetical protein
VNTTGLSAVIFGTFQDLADIINKEKFDVDQLRGLELEGVSPPQNVRNVASITMAS